MKNRALYVKILERVQEDPKTGCWNWTGASWRKRKYPGNRYGYISLWDPDTKKTTCVGTHRAMMMALVGDLTRKQCVCHKCDNVLCVNPDHLFIGSHKDNMADSRRKHRHYLSAKTHCKRGHPLSGDNLYVTSAGLRNCKTCARARLRIKSGWPKRLAYTLPSRSKRATSTVSVGDKHE